MTRREIEKISIHPVALECVRLAALIEIERAVYRGHLPEYFLDFPNRLPVGFPSRPGKEEWLERRFVFTVTCACGHQRTESMSRRLARRLRRKFGPGAVRRQIRFFAQNDCQSCHNHERYQARGIVEHLRTVLQ